MKGIIVNGIECGIPNMELIPDSALVLQGNPLFIPDFASQWRARIYITAHICRLGKAISQKFAYRYYDGISISLRAVPGLTEVKGALLSAFDNCIVPGQWIAGCKEGSTTVTIDSKDFVIENINKSIDCAIEAVSRFMTLRMGDIIMPVCLEYKTALAPDMIIDGYLDGVPSLHARLK